MFGCIPPAATNEDLLRWADDGGYVPYCIDCGDPHIFEQCDREPRRAPCFTSVPVSVWNRVSVADQQRLAGFGLMIDISEDDLEHCLVWADDTVMDLFELVVYAASAGSFKPRARFHFPISDSAAGPS